MPICELEQVRTSAVHRVPEHEVTQYVTQFQKWWGMNFNIAAEEMRRLKASPTEEEQIILYRLYKQALHGDIPSEELYSYLSPASAIMNMLYFRTTDR